MKLTIFSILFSLIVSTQAHAWVKISDFEGGTIGEKANTHTSGSDGAFALTVFSDEKSFSGKQSAKATVTKGSTGWKEWGMRYSFPPVREGGEIWFRAWLYFPPDFQYDSHHGPKGLRIRTSSSNGDGEPYFNIYPNEPYIWIENGIDGPSFKNNVPQKKFAPGLQGWEALEMNIKFHSTPGKGAYRVWRNGKLLLEDLKTATLKSSGSYADLAYIFTLFSNNGSPVTQSNFVDDVIITNERPSNIDANGNPFIGVGDVEIISPPNAPTNIQ